VPKQSRGVLDCRAEFTLSTPLRTSLSGLDSRLPSPVGQVARNDETRAAHNDKRMLLNNLRLKELAGYNVL